MGHQSCKYIDVPKYEQVPEEKCHYVTIPHCKKVPQQHCSSYKVPHCKNVPHQECHKEYKKKCHPLLICSITNPQTTLTSKISWKQRASKNGHSFCKQAGACLYPSFWALQQCHTVPQRTSLYLLPKLIFCIYFLLPLRQ